MKMLAIIVLAAVASTVPNGDGNKINVSSMTCSQFLQSDQNRSNVILAWFLGFYAQVENPQVIDLTQLDQVRDRFNTFCAQQPGFYMTTAAEGLLGK
jgi:acid stress chaperone HdeB